DRFNVIPSEVEGSRYVTLKVPQRDSSVRAGLAVTLGTTKRESRPSKRFLRFLYIARAIFEPGKFFQKGEGNFTHRPVALFGNDQFRFALLLRPRFLVFLVNLRTHQQAHQIGILLNRSGLAQIAQSRFSSGTCFGLSI